MESYISLEIVIEMNYASNKTILSHWSQPFTTVPSENHSSFMMIRLSLILTKNLRTDGKMDSCYSKSVSSDSEKQTPQYNQ